MNVLKMNVLKNIKLLYFIIIIYFLQLYYLLYLNDKKDIFIFIITLLIVNFYYNNLIIGVLISFVILYTFKILQLLNNKEETIKYLYVLDKFEPNIEEGINMKTYENNESTQNNETIHDIFDINDLNKKINNSKLIVQ